MSRWLKHDETLIYATVFCTCLDQYHGLWQTHALYSEMCAKGWEKEALFAELHQLDEWDSDGEETFLKAFTRPKAVAPVISRTRVSLQSSSVQHSPRQTSSSALQAKPPLQSSDVHVIHDTPPEMPNASKDHNAAAKPRRTPISKSFTSMGDIRKTSNAKTGTKRKRGESLEILPESQKIFTGLSFCMGSDLYQFPN